MTDSILRSYYNVSTTTFVPFAITVSNAQQFLDRVAAQDSTHIAAYTALADGLVASGTWDKLDALYLLAAAEEATALENFIQDAYNATVVNSPTFTVDEGYTGANTKYLDSGFNPSTASGNYTQDACSAFTWQLTSTAVNGGTIGFASAATNALSIEPRFSDNNYYIAIGNAGQHIVASTDASGLFIISRTSTSSSDVYVRGGSAHNTNTGTAQALKNENILILRDNDDEYIAGQVAVAGFGGALDSTDNTALNSLLTAYLTAVGAI